MKISTDTARRVSIPRANRVAIKRNTYPLPPVLAPVPVRSGEPTLLGDALVAHVVVRMRRRALHLLGIAVEIVADGEADHAAVLPDHLLGVGVILAALLVVELGAGGEDQLVELRLAPVRVVPVGVGEEGLRELVVGARPAAPVDRAERVLQPDVAPVAVAGDALDVEVDARLLQRLLLKHRAVGRAG